MKVLFEENFTGSLDPDWIWVHEQSKSWKVADGALHLRTLPGTLWGDANNAHNFLLRSFGDLPNGLTSRVAVTNHPHLMGEQAGLIWYLDDDNYIKLVKESLEGLQWIVMAREQGGQPELIAKTRISVESAELQLILQDGIVYGQFRTSPKEDWQIVGECPLLEADAPKIGIFTHGGPGEIERWVEMRSFALLRTEQ
jgi:regulation of enolase protein 1 (concanavalin A-like superfamily)